jgi:hypothetical protein
MLEKPAPFVAGRGAFADHTGFAKKKCLEC